MNSIFVGAISSSERLGQEDTISWEDSNVILFFISDRHHNSPQPSSLKLISFLPNLKG
jgi:hypothetical protein